MSRKKELYIFTNTFYLWFMTIRPYIQNLGQLKFIIFNQPTEVFTTLQPIKLFKNNNPTLYDYSRKKSIKPLIYYKILKSLIFAKKI